MVPCTAKYARSRNLSMNVDVKAKKRDGLLKSDVRKDILPALQELRTGTGYLQITNVIWFDPHGQCFLSFLFQHQKLLIIHIHVSFVSSSFFVEFVAQSASLRNQCMLENDAMEDLAASVG